MYETTEYIWHHSDVKNTYLHASQIVAFKQILIWSPKQSEADVCTIVLSKLSLPSRLQICLYRHSPGSSQCTRACSDGIDGLKPNMP
jgi:hypothetical protein